MKNTIGIIGCGVVGGAVRSYFCGKNYTTVVYDKFLELGSMREVVGMTDLAFVSVPTPTNDGLQDLSALNDVLGTLTELGYNKPVVIKSTVLPGTCDQLQQRFKTIRIIHNPEFLTEKDAVTDFARQRAIVLSGHDQDALFKVYTLFCRAFPNAQVDDYSDFKVTEMGKYIHNCFLATKVAFMNEIHSLCQTMEINYHMAIQVARSQGGIGANHTSVPGPDGHLGFGGMCFVKDTEALLKFNTDILTILDAAVRANRKVRPSAYDGTENVGNT